MFAYPKPLDTDTLVIELDKDSALALHGTLLQTYENTPLRERLLSALEAFHAGTDMERFAPDTDSVEDCGCYVEVEPSDHGHTVSHFIPCCEDHAEVSERN